MEVACKDSVFGEMKYRHRWYKEQPITAFGKNWVIKVVAKAYSGKAITAEQQKAYKAFCAKEKEAFGLAGEQLKSYVNDNLQKLSAYWNGAREVDDIRELAQMVTPQSLLFKQDGTTILLLDCEWDVEHGVAVELFPRVAVGPQVAFL